jgi:uncharacterized membrane protein YdcZ (DUF606 family)
MTSAFYIVVVFAVGLGGATQGGMLASIGRDKTALEAAWISTWATLAGLALVLAARSLRGDAPLLPAPLDRLEVQALVAIVSGAFLLRSLRGLDGYLAVTGLFGLAIIVSSALFIPRLGAALFFSAFMAGILIGGVFLDHFGAFGQDVSELSVAKVAGVLVLMAGVVIVRFAQ